MSTMYKAFIKEVTYYVENMEEEEIQNKLTLQDIKEIASDVINDSYLWQQINETIEDKIREKLENK